MTTDRRVLRTSSAHVLVSPAELRDDALVSLDESTEHHLRRVVRLRDGEVVSVTDGAGGWRLATARVGHDGLRLEPHTAVVVDAPRERPIHLAVAMPKGDRLDWLVQKVTELDVDALTLLHAARSVVRWKPDRTDQQRARLQRVADEACRQSRRVHRLVIDGPRAALDVLDKFVVAEPGGDPLAAEHRAIAIGPEGGWAPEELEAARGRVDLGATILRTETAAVAAAALCVATNR